MFVKNSNLFWEIVVTVGLFEYVMMSPVFRITQLDETDLKTNFKEIVQALDGEYIEYLNGFNNSGD